MPDVQSIRIERARNADVPALIELLAALFAIESDFSADPQDNAADSSCCWHNQTIGPYCWSRV